MPERRFPPPWFVEEPRPGCSRSASSSATGAVRRSAVPEAPLRFGSLRRPAEVRLPDVRPDVRHAFQAVTSCLSKATCSLLASAIVLVARPVPFHHIAPFKGKLCSGRSRKRALASKPFDQVLIAARCASKRRLGPATPTLRLARRWFCGSRQEQAQHRSWRAKAKHWRAATSSSRQYRLYPFPLRHCERSRAAMNSPVAAWNKGDLIRIQGAIHTVAFSGSSAWLYKCSLTKWVGN
jgi:hypothetical protein